MPAVTGTSEAGDDFYQPGDPDQNRPLDDVLEDLQEFPDGDGDAKLADEIMCRVCETGEQLR